VTKHQGFLKGFDELKDEHDMESGEALGLLVTKGKLPKPVRREMCREMCESSIHQR
jgi:hypothetical protein